MAEPSETVVPALPLSAPIDWLKLFRSNVPPFTATALAVLMTLAAPARSVPAETVVAPE